MWVQKFCKPSVRGNFGCIKPLLQSRIIGMDVGKYEGEWKYGLEHGHGIRTSSNGGIIFIGKWKNGKYFHGTYYFDNGDKHFGFFKDGVAKGHGIRTYFDGRKYTRKYTKIEKFF